MVLPNETIKRGAPAECPDCQAALEFKVMCSAAGHYIGTGCCCGPYSRESGYYPNFLTAMEVLETGEFDR